MVATPETDPQRPQGLRSYPKVDAFVGRQPIFDRQLRLVGYELMFRTAGDDGATFSDPDHATSSVLLSTFIDFGLERVVGQVRAHINFSERYVLGDYPIPAARDRIVVEVPMPLALQPAAALPLKLLTGAGYRVALDGFTFSDTAMAVLDSVTAVKIDISNIDREELKRQMSMLEDHSVQFYAMRIADRDTFHFCRSLGFHYYQGDFLCEPELIRERQPQGDSLTLMRLLARLYDPEVRTEEIEQIISTDVSLSHRLLRCINSAMFSLPERVTSLRHMVVLLGRRRLREWVSLIAMCRISGKPNELMVTAMVRAKMCETVALALRVQASENYFAAGLFSVIDALLGMPMERVVQELPLSDELRAALVSGEGAMGEVLQCAIAHERGDFGARDTLGLPVSTISSAWLHSVEWAEQMREALRPGT